MGSLTLNTPQQLNGIGMQADHCPAQWSYSEVSGNRYAGSKLNESLSAQQWSKVFWRSEAFI